MKDLLALSLSKSGKQDQVISSLVWKVIVQEYKTLKNIDIHAFIISVKIKENSIIIHTGKPILNTELYHLESHFLGKIQEKLDAIGILKKNLKIRFQ